MEPRILVLGAIAYDNIMAFDGLHYENYSVEQNTKKFYLTIMPNKRWMNFGGTSGNISYNLALMGAQVLVITSVGHDYISGGYKEHHLKFKNLKLDIDIHSDEFTASAYIVNDRNNNLVNIFHPGALNQSKLIKLSQKGINKEKIKICSVSPDNPEAMINWSKELIQLEIPFIFDPGQVTSAFSKEIFQEIIPKAFLVIGNEFEIGMIQKKLDTDLTGLRKLNSRIIMTKGVEGSICYEKDTTHMIQIVKPNVVIDTTGAGDGYRSGLLYGLAYSCSLKQSCQIGSTIASFVVETPGPQTQKFTIEDVKKRYRKTFNEDFPIK